MTARVLAPEEWAAKLVGTSLAQAAYDPAEAFVLVVENAEGEVVGCWSAVNTVHVEGIWERPDHRGHAGVGRALLVGMVQELQARGVREVLTNADTPEIEAMLQKVGAIRLPGTCWLLKVR